MYLNIFTNNLIYIACTMLAIKYFLYNYITYISHIIYICKKFFSLMTLKEIFSKNNRFLISQNFYDFIQLPHYDNLFKFINYSPNHLILKTSKKLWKHYHNFYEQRNWSELINDLCKALMLTATESRFEMFSNSKSYVCSFH